MSGLVGGAQDFPQIKSVTFFKVLFRFLVPPFCGILLKVLKPHEPKNSALASIITMKFGSARYGNSYEVSNHEGKKVQLCSYAIHL